MTRDECLARIAAVITTLAETKGSPESILYLACGSNLSEWEIIRSVLVESGNVVIRGHFATLTAVGEETARRLENSISQNAH